MFNKSKKGVMTTDSMINMLLAVLIFASIGGSIATAVSDSDGNFSGAALTLWLLTTLFVVIAFIRGLVSKKK